MYDSEAMGKLSRATILDILFISCNIVSFPKQERKLKSVLRICECEKLQVKKAIDLMVIIDILH